MGLWSNIGIALLCISVICFIFVFEYCRRKRQKEREGMSSVKLLNFESEDYNSKDRQWKYSYENQKDDQSKQEVQTIKKKISIEQQIQTKPIQQQIQILHQEINKLDHNDDLTKNQKQYQKHQYQQQLIAKLKASGEVKSIPHVKQNIEASNPELAFYVLKESLQRDQNRELLTTSKQYSFGFDSILGAFGQDQSCFKVRNTNLDYDTIVNDSQLLQQHLLEFKQKLSKSLNILIDQIEILGVSKGSFEISFQIIDEKGNINMDVFEQQKENNANFRDFLNNYCNGQIEYVGYFDQASKHAKGVTLSSDDFNPQYNMSWDGFPEKEQRGPPNYEYEYYFPIGCYGFGLNVKKYGANQDWLQMDGNPNEWRIMYHGTHQPYVNLIVKNNLKAGSGQACEDHVYKDKFGNNVKVGKGIYFSDQYTVCIDHNYNYVSYTKIGDKEFAPIFMSRVNPKVLKHGGSYMIKYRYFVINDSKDVRPYRILIHEKKK